MRRLELEAESVKALSAATNELMIAACELGLSGKVSAALRANQAAKEANAQVQSICDAVLSRTWVRFFDWMLGKSGG